MTIPMHVLPLMAVLLAGLFGCMFWAGRMDREAARDRQAQADDQRRRGALATPQHRRPSLARLADPTPTLAELLDAAFDIAEGKATRREAEAEVRQIWAEVEAHPERWAHQP